jgi:molybdate transport system regulatory protein
MRAPIVRFRIDFSEGCGVAPANIDLLEAIRNVGSLSQGARSLGMSYRRARLLIDSFKGAFKQPVTRAVRGGAGGGGVMLTEFGAELVDRYRELEREIGSLAARRLQSISASVAFRSGLKSLHPRRPTQRRV